MFTDEGEPRLGGDVTLRHDLPGRTAALGTAAAAHVLPMTTGTTCIACAVQKTAVSDIAAVAVLGYAWAHQLSVDQLCRGLCMRHEIMFRAGVSAAGVPGRAGVKEE